MFKNYLLVTVRNLKKNSTYSLLNIIGLAVGMTAFILIALYVQYELSFDKYHENADRIYRVVREERVFTPAPLGPALNDPSAIVLSQRTAKKYFGDEDPMGKILTVSERYDFKVSGVFGSFAILAIFIACLGLFGLTAFAAEQRTKEIGIRKVLGASDSKIFQLLSKEFIRWVLLANLLAWPLAYFAMNKWLQNFAYRIHIGIAAFLISGGTALLIAYLTVSYQSIKSARANPADSLRYE